MARKRPSLKDKNVFKRSKEKELDTLLGAKPKSDAPDEAAPAKKSATAKKTTTRRRTSTRKTTAKKTTDTAESPAKKPAATRSTKKKTPTRRRRTSTRKAADPAEELAALAAEAEATQPANVPAPRDSLPVSIGENLPHGEAGDTTDYGAPYDNLPVALETAPGGPLHEHLPSSEAGELYTNVDPYADFPAALDAPPGGIPVENLPSEEIGDMDFPVAAAQPPSGAPKENLPSGEIGDDTTPLNPVIDFPAASGGTSATDEMDLSALLDSALAEEPAPAKPAPTFPTAESSVPTAPSAPPEWSSIGTPTSSSVSRSSALSLGTGRDFDNLFDFTKVDDELPTLSFEIPANAEDLSPEEMKERRRLLNDPRIREQFLQVYNGIDGLYEKILDENISVSKEITDWSHKLLAETRYIVMNYQIKYLAKAEWNIEQVKARLDRAEESARQGERWSRWLVVWGMLWFVVFVYLIFKPDILLDYLTSNKAISDLLVPDVFLRSLFFGAVGGVAAVFHSLLKYISKRRFDVEFVLSYFVKPFMGMIVGTLIYLMVYVVMRPFGLTPAVLQQTTPEGSTSRLIFEVLSYFLAAAAGFKENLAFDLLGRVLKIVFRDQDVADDVVPPPPPGPFPLEGDA